MVIAHELRPEASVGLAGRHILVISPRFFGYETRICEHLRARGATVAWVDDRASNAPIGKAAIRLGLASSNDARYVEAAGNLDPDDILIISPESCSASAARRLRRAFPQARFLLYMWDSFENKRTLDPAEYVALFDRTMTFDELEAERLGIGFRPLFYAGELPPPHDDRPEYAFSFVGTIHSDRYRVLRKLCRQADEVGLRYFVYPYLPARFLFWAHRVVKPEFWRARASDFRFDPLAYDEVLRVTASSRAIVDIEHPRQRGLTMRTLEVLGARCKLLTTNRSVKKYPFYSPERICILDRKSPRLDPAFFRVPAPPLPDGFADTYSLAAWVNSIFV